MAMPSNPTIPLETGNLGYDMSPLYLMMKNWKIKTEKVSPMLFEMRILLFCPWTTDVSGQIVMASLHAVSRFFHETLDLLMAIGNLALMLCSDQRQASNLQLLG